MRIIDCNFSCRLSNLSSSRYPTFFAIKSCVSNSKADPNENSKNRLNSSFDFRDVPSAIFEDIETTDRRI